MKTWKDIGFEVEYTADQSPSLRLLQSVDPLKFKGESMHHSGGAWAETKLIYADPLSELLQKQQKDLRFIVVGLGLGYIEMCIARQCLLAGLSPQSIDKIISYETVPELKDFFFKWLSGDSEQLSEEVRQVYDLVAQYVIQETSLKTVDIQSFLKYHFSKITDFRGALTLQSLPQDVNVIFYDAFSSKTTPYLWEQAFLEEFLYKTSVKPCVFLTYACRVSLKQALAATGFQFEARPSFKGKRNRTVAWKV